MTKEVGKISIRVMPDVDNFRSQLKRELDNLERSLKVQVRVAAKGLKKLRADIEAASRGGNAVVDLDADTSRFREKLDAATRGNNSVVVNTDLHTERLKAEMLASLAELKAIAAHGVDIRVGIDKTLASQLGTAKQAITNIGSELTAITTEGVSSIGRTGAMVAAGVALIPPAVALASGALAAIPAALAALAAPIATITVGLDGIKTAAAGLAPEMENLKASVSSTFASAMAPAFEQLQSVFPALTAGMQQVASGLSTAFAGVVAGLTSDSGLASISSMFQNIGQAISAAAPGLQNFTTGLLGMAANVTSLFPQMSQWFNSISQSFASWVTQMTTAGANGVSPLQTAMQGLGSILKEVGPLIGDLVNKGLKLLSDPGFITGAVQSMQALRDLANAFMSTYQVAVQINSVFTGLENLLTNTGASFRSLGTIIQTSFSAAVGVVQMMAGSVSSAVSAAFGQISGIVSTAFSAAAGAVAAGVSSVVSEVASLGGKVLSACGNFGGLLVSAGADLIRGLVNGIKSMAGAAVQAVTDVAGSAISAAKSLLGIHSPSVVFNDIGTNIGEGLVNGLDAQKQAVAAASAELAKAATTPWNDVAGKGLNAKIQPQDGGMFGQIGNDIGHQAIQGITSVGQNVAKSYAQDLGISGNGALGALADYGMNFAQKAATNLTFHVSNIDEARSLWQHQERKEALSFH